MHDAPCIGFYDKIKREVRLNLLAVAEVRESQISTNTDIHYSVRCTTYTKVFFAQLHCYMFL